MIYESIYWKRELTRLSKKLEARKVNKRCWTNTQNGAFEKEVMIGFYIVRKLYESQKLPNTVASTKLKGKKYPNNGSLVHRVNYHRVSEHYDFEKVQELNFDLKFLANQIIHSYIFLPIFGSIEENGIFNLYSICFCSDEHRNKWIYEISLNTLIELFEGIGECNISSGRYDFSPQKKDYIFFQSDEKGAPQKN